MYKSVADRNGINKAATTVNNMINTIGLSKESNIMGGPAIQSKKPLYHFDWGVTIFWRSSEGSFLIRPTKSQKR